MFYVMLRTSQKTGKLYAALYADLGYTQKPISFDRYLIAELLKVSVVDLMCMAVDERIPLE